MAIPLIIGRTSDGSICRIDIATCPNLFVSYHDDNSKCKLWQQLLTLPTDIALYLTGSNQRIQQLVPTILKRINTHTHYWDEPKSASIEGGYQFLNILYTELQRRSRKSNHDGNHTILVVIDDIWQLLLKTRKRSAFILMSLLVYGEEVGIHFVVGSTFSYRNLLQQLMFKNTEIKAIFGKLHSENNIFGISLIGAELIISPDGLVFYKQRNCMDLVKYYSL